MIVKAIHSRSGCCSAKVFGESVSLKYQSGTVERDAEKADA
jgi:hypothetical protein